MSLFLFAILVLKYNLCQKSWNTWSSFKTFCITSPSPSQNNVDCARYKRSTWINLPEDNSHRCIPSTQHCFKGEGMVILRCRPEIYYYHVKCFYWMVFQGLLAEIVHKYEIYILIFYALDTLWHIKYLIVY